MLLIFYLLAYLMLAVLAFSVFLIPWVMLRERKLRPEVISLDSARRHFLLVYLICGTEWLILGALLSMLALMTWGLFLQINPFSRPPGMSLGFSVGVLAIMLLLVAYFISRAIHWFPMGRASLLSGFRNLTVNSVSDFAFVFAAFVAHDLYHFLPPSNHAAGHEPANPAALFLERDMLWVIVFWCVWRSTKSLLVGLLRLK